MLRTESGATYRVPAEGFAPPKPRAAFASLAATVAVPAIAVGVWMVAAPRPPRTASPETLTVAPASESVSIERAAYKSGHADIVVGLVKPTVHKPSTDGKPFASPAPMVDPQPELLPAPDRVLLEDFWTTPKTSAAALLGQVAAFPEIGLAGKDFVGRQWTSAMARKIQSRPGNTFLTELIEKRDDLSGLPWVLGEACQLDKNASRKLAIHSTEITRLLDGRFDGGGHATITLPKPPPADRSEAEQIEIFWNAYAHRGGYHEQFLVEGASTLEQVLMAKSPMLRKSFTLAMKDAKDAAPKILVRRALFDLDPEVRQAAVETLAGRERSEYGQRLIEGFRYPWAPVARHAAEALVSLKRSDLVEPLKKLAKERDPYVAKVKQKTSLREPVLVNHFMNCLLCHPPIESWKAQRLLAEALDGHPTAPVGVAPIPGEPIPKNYLDEMSANVFVRADATFLRQDFSVRIDVALAGAWPKSQRFDVLVRTRPLEAHETIRHPEDATLEQSPNGPALAFAIERLQAIGAASAAAASAKSR